MIKIIMTIHVLSRAWYARTNAGESSFPYSDRWLTGWLAGWLSGIIDHERLCVHSGIKYLECQFAYMENIRFENKVRITPFLVFWGLCPLCALWNSPFFQYKHTYMHIMVLSGNLSSYSGWIKGFCPYWGLKETEDNIWRKYIMKKIVAIEFYLTANLLIWLSFKEMVRKKSITG